MVASGVYRRSYWKARNVPLSQIYHDAKQGRETLPRGDGIERVTGVGLFATHLLDPVPTEVHVFWNLWTGIPLYIATPPNGTIWKISKGAISLVKRGKQRRQLSRHY